MLDHQRSCPRSLLYISHQYPPSGCVQVHVLISHTRSVRTSANVTSYWPPASTPTFSSISDALAYWQHWLGIRPNVHPTPGRFCPGVRWQPNPPTLQGASGKGLSPRLRLMDGHSSCARPRAGSRPCHPQPELRGACAHQPRICPSAHAQPLHTSS